MLKLFRYILSKRNSWKVKRITSDTDNDILKLHALLQLKQHNGIVNMPVKERLSRYITCRAVDIQQVLESLYMLLSVVEQHNPKLKYIDKVPLWFANESTSKQYDRYMVINSGFINETDLLHELSGLITKLVALLKEERNVKLNSYYQTKMSKLYAELLVISTVL